MGYNVSYVPTVPTMFRPKTGRSEQPKGAPCNASRAVVPTVPTYSYTYTHITCARRAHTHIFISYIGRNSRNKQHNHQINQILTAFRPKQNRSEQGRNGRNTATKGANK